MKKYILKILKILLGGRQLSVDSHFSCSMGNLNSRKKGGMTVYFK